MDSIQSHPIITIVGRPNVGKSTLFNRLVGQRRSIVHDRPGITRDRIFALAPLQKGQVWLVDTGGLGNPEGGALADVVNQQVDQAVEEANLLLFLLDGREGLTALDEEIAAYLRKRGKPMLAVVNKMDPAARKTSSEEFFKLGFDPLLEVSAEHNSGIDALRESIESQFSSNPAFEISAAERRNVTASLAFLGRPNVGKSSLINAILKEPRVAVSDAPGTTRDVVDTFLETGEGTFTLLDTAGLRRKTKVTDEIEAVSAIRALRAIGRCDVAVLVLDAADQMTTQDERIGGAVVEQGCGLLVAANKWDLVKDSESSRHEFREELYEKAPFLRFAAVRFVSAKTGLGVQSILKDAKRIRERKAKIFTPQELDPEFDDLAQYSPGGKAGYKLRLHSLTQAQERLPTFFVWCNDPRWATPEYERFWENELTLRLKLEGIPIRVIFRRKPTRGRNVSSAKGRPRTKAPGR